jgi:hypothetical protein
MTSPIRIFRPQSLAGSADEVHRRLTADPQALVADATADAITRSAPLLRRWGVVARTLPTVSAEPSAGGELGSLTVRWHGVEEVTGWPAMTARLLVTPTGPTGCELTLATTRAPALGLRATQLSELHRRRVVHVLVAAFLLALADRLEQAPAPALEHAGAAR